MLFPGVDEAIELQFSFKGRLSVLIILENLKIKTLEFLEA